MRRAQPYWGHFGITSVVRVLLTGLVLLKVRPIEESYVGLLVKGDLDNVGRSRVKLILKEIHAQGSCDIEAHIGYRVKQLLNFTTSETAHHRQVPTVPRACDSRLLPSSLPGRVRGSARL